MRTMAMIACAVVLLPIPARAFCFAAAAQEYRLPDRLLMCIAKVESGFNPAAVHQNAASVDVGLMQINSGHYRRLEARAGKLAADQFWTALGDPCYNVRYGAFVLADCVHRHGNTWTAVGCYNATSPAKRADYAWKIYHCLKSGNNGR